MPVASKKEFVEDIKGVLQEWKGQNGKTVSRLRVVAWVVDGKPTRPKLEIREWFIQEDGSEKMGKVRGLTKKDVEYVIEHWSEIQMMFE